MNILVVAAHPDDEILGVGGTLLKHKAQGDDIYICVMTNAQKPEYTKEYIKKKTSMQRQVDEKLGVKKRFNLDFKTVNMNTMPHGVLNKAVGDVIIRVKPDIIYTHFEHDLNYDHTLTFRACMVACRPPRHIKLICFEIVGVTENGYRPFHPNYWVDITPYIVEKMMLFDVYETEKRDAPYPRSNWGIANLGLKRGQDIGIHDAEAFMIIKEYWI